MCESSNREVWVCWDTIGVCLLRLWLTSDGNGWWVWCSALPYDGYHHESDNDHPTCFGLTVNASIHITRHKHPDKMPPWPQPLWLNLVSHNSSVSPIVIIFPCFVVCFLSRPVAYQFQCASAFLCSTLLIRQHSSTITWYQSQYGGDTKENHKHDDDAFHNNS